MSLHDELEDKVVVDPADVRRMALAKGTRELARDPVEVLRTWPHTKAAHDARAPAADAGRAAPCRRRVEDKIMLAHLALDLYREAEQLATIAYHVHGTLAGDAGPAPCTSKRCAERVDVLRGALVEACLLVQRIAMSPAPVSTDIEDRIIELLDLLE